MLLLLFVKLLSFINLFLHEVLKSHSELCKYLNIIDFPILQLIRRRRREGGKTLDISKTISAFDVMVYDFCLLLFNPGLKKQMVRFSRKLKTEAKLIQNCSAIRQGKSILSFSFFFQITTHQKRGLAS